ncbi:hypothetical protein CPB84DRAFT_1748512 [Gymnopilus junonius]|uniref:Uncharacterized protein n=1 Tax=Gymnopilus junonius TaxID=109634 RepID=A0A9P5TKV1_GYMJU|nr:hypothetical protein CPB84DRAFT_1748512 [Gymnopilus junonius]
MTDGKWFWGGKVRWEVEENDELERQDQCTPYIPTPGLSRVGTCGSRLQEVVVIVASALDDWVTTGRRHRDIEMKREGNDRSRRPAHPSNPPIPPFLVISSSLHISTLHFPIAGVEDVVANGGVALNGCIEDEKEKGKWHTKSVNNISSQQPRVNFEADKVRVRVGWLAIGKMATISIMATSQILVVFVLGLYYYSPARRTRMEEEDMEGIELEAGGGGAGNIRRRAVHRLEGQVHEFRHWWPPKRKILISGSKASEATTLGPSTDSVLKASITISKRKQRAYLFSHCHLGIVIQKNWQRERFLPPCEPPPNTVPSVRPTLSSFTPLQPIVFDLDSVLVLFPVVSKMQTAVARLLGERQRKSLLWPGQAVDEGLLAPEVWAQVSSCATRGRGVDVDCGIAEQVKIGERRQATYSLSPEWSMICQFVEFSVEGLAKTTLEGAEGQVWAGSSRHLELTRSSRLQVESTHLSSCRYACL